MIFGQKFMSLKFRKILLVTAFIGKKNDRKKNNKFDRRNPKRNFNKVRKN